MTESRYYPTPSDTFAAPFADVFREDDLDVLRGSDLFGFIERSKKREAAEAGAAALGAEAAASMTTAELERVGRILTDGVERKAVSMLHEAEQGRLDGGPILLINASYMPEVVLRAALRQCEEDRFSCVVTVWYLTARGVHMKTGFSRCGSSAWSRAYAELYEAQLPSIVPLDRWAAFRALAGLPPMGGT